MSRGDWMRTRSGGRFYPADPRADEVHIVDIASGLSKECRYGGQLDDWYCPTPEQRILKSDLSWVPAGDIKLGDELVGFDEGATTYGGGGKPRRRLRASIVTETRSVRRPIIRLELSDGSTVRSSDSHPWLVAIKGAGNQKWATAESLLNDVAAGRKRYMHKFVPTWSQRLSRDDGWLAGMADGEGCVTIKNRGIRMAIAQKPGPILEQMKSLMVSGGVEFTEASHASSGVNNLAVLGGWRGIAKFLGEYRPERLVTKFTTSLRDSQFEKQMQSDGNPLQIVNAWREGEDWVAGISTSTRTYLCEGYAAHNCVAEHSILVASVLPDHLKLQGLLHDAPEAYLRDMVRPAKVLMPEYYALEDKAWAAVAARFGLPLELDPAVKQADNDVLLAEKAQLFSEDTSEWSIKGTPADVYLFCWDYRAAEAEFLRYFHHLTKGIYQ